MESKWRTNVYELGFWGMEYKMCARLVGLDFLAIFWSPPGFPFFEMWVENPSADWGWEFFDFFRKPRPYPHFPYGVEVEPD